MEKRKIDLDAEREFENQKVAGDNPRRKMSKYYWAVQPYVDRHNSLIKKGVKGKSVLEIGCTYGALAPQYARNASDYTGIDISDKGIEKARTLGISNATFVVGDAHELPFEDQKFDVVIVNALLHHLDLKVALEEINRVLRRGGTLYAREPLGTNPLINAYRNVTPKARTIDERPFSRADLLLMRAKFEPRRETFFGFLSILSAPFGHAGARAVTIKIDNLLNNTPLRYLYWQFSGEYQKPKN